MSRPQTLSPSGFKDLAAMKRKVLGVTRPQGTGSQSPPPDTLWYWGVLLADVSAASNAWTGATVGYCKLMVPDATDSSTPQHFIEAATGAITGATNASPIVLTSAEHHRRDGELIYVFGVGGNTAANGLFQVDSPTLDTFELLSSTGSGSYTSGGNWYLAQQFTNRSVTLSGTAGTLCKIEYGWGEWSLKWIDC